MKCYVECSTILKVFIYNESTLTNDFLVHFVVTWNFHRAYFSDTLTQRYLSDAQINNHDEPGLNAIPDNLKCMQLSNGLHHASCC